MCHFAGKPKIVGFGGCAAALEFPRSAATSRHRHVMLSRRLKGRLLAALGSASRRAVAASHALLLTSNLAAHEQLLKQFIERLSRAPATHAYATLIRPSQLRASPFPFNYLISCYIDAKNPRAGLSVYLCMTRDGFSADQYTFPLLFKACAKFLGIEEGKQIHASAIKVGLFWPLHVKNAIVHLYGICSRFLDARRAFDDMLVKDVVSWTALISAYVKGGSFETALDLFRAMDVSPNTATLINVIVTCGRLQNLTAGTSLHGLIVKKEPDLGLIVGNALLDMYAKCGDLDDAKRVFNEMSERDIWSWTGIISGLVQCRRSKEALEEFDRMRAAGLEPDKVVLSSIMAACASLGALVTGQWVHEYIERKCIEWDVHLGTSMVDMYAKCGCVEMALLIFQRMPHKNVSSWNALLGGLAVNGYGCEALEYFRMMVNAGCKPNEVTFIAVLSACAHSGKVEEGRGLFESMIKSYRLTPWVEHFGCMVDLLGRAGLIGEAYDLIKAMPIKADAFVWSSMLRACQAHGNMDFFNQVISSLHDFKPNDGGVFVLLSNIHAINDSWKDVLEVRKVMRRNGLQKEPGSSIIELDGKTHEFFIGGHDHQNMEQIMLVLHMIELQFSAGF